VLASSYEGSPLPSSAPTLASGLAVTVDDVASSHRPRPRSPGAWPACHRF